MKRAKWIFIVTLLGVAILQNYLVGERVHAAIFQWDHFKDYGGGGSISLGRQTGFVFYALSSLCAAVSAYSARKLAPQTVWGKRLFWVPTTLFSVGILAYTVLALSPLNSGWRP